MKRGTPSSSTGRNAKSEHPQQEQASTSNAAAAAGDIGAASTAEGAVKEEPISNFLVGLAGTRALTSHIQDINKGRTWKERAKGWEEKAGLSEPSVKLALGFLDILGVSRASVYKQLFENSVSVLLDKIPHLEKKVMEQLLGDSFKYISNADLKCVPLKIISSMPQLPEKVLKKIVELQTNQPEQFEELGLSIGTKRAAWEADFQAFVRVVSPLAEKYIASDFSPKMVMSSQQVRFYRSLDTIKRRKLMKIDDLAELTGGRPVLIGYLCDYITDRFKGETSLSQAGLWASLLTDVLVTTRERPYSSGSGEDPTARLAVDRLCALASRLDLAVREDVFNDATVRDVQRLFRQATGIGEGSRESTSTAAQREARLEQAKHEDDSARLKETLKSAWTMVTKLDKNKWFKEPVTEQIAQGYHKIIKTPMDLGTILKKIRGGGYTSFGDFDRDLKLMWKNCRTYNLEGTQFYEEALRQEEEWSKISVKLEEKLRQHESRPNFGGNKRKSGGGGGGGGSHDNAWGVTSSAPLAPLAPATQLDRQGIGRLVGLASVLLSEPFAAKLMYRHASDRVPQACLEQGVLPRDHPVFAPLLQLLDLGEYARPMLRAETFGVRAVESVLTRTVLPCVVALHARAEAAAGRHHRVGGDINAATTTNTGATSEADERGEDALAAASHDWKAWYKEFPAIRRLVCTMLCRALVRGCDEGAALLVPAAAAAAKRMGDQRWLWASLAELLQKSADAAAAAAGTGSGGGDAGNRNGKEKGARGVLKPETLVLILKLFSTGLESASVSDAVFLRALNVVAKLLPLASAPSPPPPRPRSSANACAADAADAAVFLPLSALEEVVDQAAVRATRPPRRPRTEAEDEAVREAFAGVFARSPPEWANKLSECRAKQAKQEKASSSSASSSKKKAPEIGSGVKDGGSEGGASAALGGGSGGVVVAGGRAPPPTRQISIKGPKREREEAAAATGTEADRVGSNAARQKRSRRVNV